MNMESVYRQRIESLEADVAAIAKGQSALAAKVDELIDRVESLERTPKVVYVRDDDRGLP